MMVMLTQRTASQVSHGEIALVVMGQRVCAGQRKTRAQYCDDDCFPHVGILSSGCYAWEDASVALNPG
jgi:hypothetical protein